MLNKTIFAVSLMTASSFTLAESPISTETIIPNLFKSGDSIAAQTMNENFEALATAANNNEADIAGLLSRIEALESANAEISKYSDATNLSRFNGTYSSFGRDIIVDSCIDSPDLTNAGFPATVAILDGVMTLVTHEKRVELSIIDQDASTVEFTEIDKETSTFQVDVDGNITMTDNDSIAGSMSLNGDSFTFHAINNEDTGDCIKASIFQISGIRTSK